MPTSFYQAIPEIIEHVLIDNPSSILDVGVGFGKYGVLLREVFDIPFERYQKSEWIMKIDGVEGYENYNNPIHEYVYNKMYYGNIYTLIDDFEMYDTILLIDVIEHFEKQKGLQLIKKLLEHTNKSLIISTPIDPDPQGDYLDNSLENHVSRWSPADFRLFDINHKIINIGDNGAYLFKVYPNDQLIDSTIDIIDSKPLKKLRIGYIIPHQNLTGGLKMILQQMEQLKMRGHYIYAIYRGSEGSKVLPEWYEMEIDKEILVPPTESYNEFVNDCDLVVSSWFEQIPELLSIKPKAFYWEQGHEWLFGDIPNLYESTWLRERMKGIYQVDFPILSVSNYVADVLKTKFNRNTEVITNGVDTNFYSPKELDLGDDFTLLLVGNPSLKFKGFDTALKALRRVWINGYRFKVNWVCQYHPQNINESFPVQFIIQPSQQELRNWYRAANLFLFTSWYEGFGMPPLEAMASGTPVITTECGGNEEYINTENCLRIKPGDVTSLTSSITSLIEHPEQRKILSKKGRDTALGFKYEDVISKLETYMYQLFLNK